MAKKVSLKASHRSGIGRQHARRTRAAAKIPAVIYGAHTKSTPIELNLRDVQNIFKHATSENMLVDLLLEEGDKTNNRLAFIQEIQRNPINDQVLHLDFHEIRADEKLHARVPILAIGEPEGVRTGGGVLEQVLRELEVECLPKDLPDRIEIDVSALQVGGNIHVNQVSVPQGVTVLSHSDVSVFSVLAPVKEEVLVPTAATTAEPELVKKKAEEGEAEAPKSDAKGGEAAKATDAKAAAKPAAKSEKK